MAPRPRPRVTARSPDGVVEALEDGDRLVAVQCHPDELAGGAGPSRC